MSEEYRVTFNKRGYRSTTLTFTTIEAANQFWANNKSKWHHASIEVRTVSEWRKVAVKETHE